MDTDRSDRHHSGEALPDQQVRELERLGEALRRRVTDVEGALALRSAAAGVDRSLETKFKDVGSVSTMAVARWMEGEGEEIAREVGQEAWAIFAHLAFRREVPLNEVTKRCLRWRDSILEILADCAGTLDLGAGVLDRAERMIQRSLDVTLVRICESFEEERRRAQEELDRRQRELEFLATHDPLTGLPNRALITDRVEHELGRARSRFEPVGALFVDLDNFKGVNDSYGHAAGDELLCAVAARLRRVVRETDAVGRLGGDEFVVFADGTSLAAGPELVAERILAIFEEPFELETTGDAAVFAKASIGIATGFPDSAEQLLRDADAAMLQAKRGGRNRFLLFEPAMHEDLRTRPQVQFDLQGALEREEFELLYQPVFDLEKMAPVGVEALLRWRRPDGSLVAPADFVPLLEESGSIVEVGAWVLATACAECASWRIAGAPVGLSVNVSAVQLDHDDLVDHVEGALASSGFDPRKLTLEITETALMRDMDEALRRLSRLKRLGLRIAVDDFGTGYSSLAYLRQFPVDELKIDRSFVSDRSGDGKEDRVLLRSLVQLGKALSIATTAEGIESQRDLILVRAESCDLGQGFLFDRPLRAADAEALLEGWSESRRFELRGEVDGLIAGPGESPWHPMTG